ncbi:MAG: FtsW/RodA/SpoVE family cell cycle protein [Bacteroidales bacterium]|nr:FtsW/RodA/SpoVE family cell cycle protein [Bacteroidales bacterium]
MIRKLFIGDKGLYAILTILFLLSLIATFSTIPYKEIVGNGGTISHLMKQLLFILLGVFLIFIVGRIDYQGRFFKIGAIAIYVLSVVLCVIMLAKGVSSNQSIRDLRLLGVSIQPFEFVKVTFVLYLCMALSKGYELLNSSLKYFILYLGLPILITCGLCFTQKLSSAFIMMVIALILLFVVKINWKYVLGLVGVIVAAAVLYMAIDRVSRVNTTGKSRIKTYVENLFSGSEQYHEIDSPMIAIGNGGLTGTFPGNSEVKYYLINSESDFIFSILVEEGGMLTGLFIIIVYTLFFLRVMVIALKSDNTLGRVLAFGLGSVVLVQALVHISVAVGLMPITGEQLPFVSKGGSSLIAYCFLSGIVQSIASHHVTIKEEAAYEE